MEKRIQELEALLRRCQQFTGDYIDHAETWEMCAVAELDADICAAICDGTEGHLDKHPFEKWDAKSKSWMRDEAKINAHHAKMEETDA